VGYIVLWSDRFVLKTVKIVTDRRRWDRENV